MTDDLKPMPTFHGWSERVYGGPEQPVTVQPGERVLRRPARAEPDERPASVVLDYVDGVPVLRVVEMTLVDGVWRVPALTLPDEEAP